MNKKVLLILIAFAAVCSFAVSAGPAATAHDAGLLAQVSPGLVNSLQTAWNVQVNTKLRYLSYADKADQEGFKGVASLFRAAARSADVHAANFAKALKDLKAVPKEERLTPPARPTKENLEEALREETKLGSTEYPALMKEAKEAGKKSAEMAYLGTIKANEAHVALYKEALGNLAAWKDAKKDFLVCTVCGYTSKDMSLKKCPICSAPRDKMVTVN